MRVKGNWQKNWFELNKKNWKKNDDGVNMATAVGILNIAYSDAAVKQQ